MPLQPGTTLGPYSVAAKIGEGGMGEDLAERWERRDGTAGAPGRWTSNHDLQQFGHQLSTSEARRP